MIDIEQDFDRFRISHFGKDGKVHYKEIPIPKSEKYKWVQAGSDRKDPFYLSWDGEPVKKERTSFLNKFRTEEFFLSLGEDYMKDVYEFNNPEVWFCDIEVEVEEEFPDPALAQTRVLTVALVNPDSDVIVLGLKPLSSDQIGSIQRKLNEHHSMFKKNITFQYQYFESEREMLDTLFSHWFLKIPMLTGWNFIHFDWKFLVNRCKRLGVDPRTCSPNMTLNGQEELPMHKIVVDYLDIFKRWDRVVKVKENNKLDTIARIVLGVQKAKMPGGFMDMFHSDYEGYVFYNAVDTYLVKLLDEKLKTLQTFLMLGNVTRVPALRAYSPIAMAEAVMTREFYARKRVVADIKKASKTGSFEGAYVKDPRKGLSEDIATFDFASLYPNTMMQFNISPETYRGKFVDIPEEKSREWIKVASGAVFDNSSDSVARSVLSEFYRKRKEAKGKSFDIEKEIDILTRALSEK